MYIIILCRLKKTVTGWRMRCAIHEFGKKWFLNKNRTFVGEQWMTIKITPWKSIDCVRFCMQCLYRHVFSKLEVRYHVFPIKFLVSSNWKFRKNAATYNLNCAFKLNLELKHLVWNLKRGIFSWVFFLKYRLTTKSYKYCFYYLIFLISSLTDFYRKWLS